MEDCCELSDLYFPGIEFLYGINYMAQFLDGINHI